MAEDHANQKCLILFALPGTVFLYSDPMYMSLKKSNDAVKLNIIYLIIAPALLLKCHAPFPLHSAEYMCHIQ